jgi:hypothetical protein
MPFAHFLSLFSVSSVSIVISVLLEEWWINASFPAGVPLASYLVVTDYTFLCKKAVRAWYWPYNYVWCWGKKICAAFPPHIIPILSLVSSTTKQLCFLRLLPVCASHYRLVFMPSITIHKLFFVYSISRYFVSIYSFIEGPKDMQANLPFASMLLATWTVATR